MIKRIAPICEEEYWDWDHLSKLGEVDADEDFDMYRNVEEYEWKR